MGPCNPSNWELRICKWLNDSIDLEADTPCWHNWTSQRSTIRKCRASCFQPCEEERYRVSKISQPWTAYELRIQGQRNKHLNIKKVRLSVYFRELKEMRITETPSYSDVTLLANFGGMLGLMTGMSALSLLEILIWMLLSVAACLKYRLK